jgi:hypothetical protein
MKIIKFTVYFSFSVLIICCVNQREKIIKNELENFINTEIVIPEDLMSFYKNTDSLLKQTNIKVITYYDSLSCTPCNISNLVEWKDIIIYMEKNQSLPVFIFTLSKSSQAEIYELLRNMQELEYCILTDERGSFADRNSHLPKDKRFHTFLLDKNNKVILAGNPVYNAKLWDLYKKTINKLIASGGELKE